jgi:hypothetical protein
MSLLKAVQEFRKENCELFKVDSKPNSAEPPGERLATFFKTRNDIEPLSAIVV